MATIMIREIAIQTYESGCNLWMSQSLFCLSLLRPNSIDCIGERLKHLAAHLPDRLRQLLSEPCEAPCQDSTRWLLPCIFLAAPTCADLGPSHLDPVEEAGPAVSFSNSAADSGRCRPALAASPIELVGLRDCPTHDPSVTPLMCWSRKTNAPLQ